MKGNQARMSAPPTDNRPGSAYEIEHTPAENLSLLMRSGYGLIVMETPEERRAINIALDASTTLKRPCWAWSSVRGLVSLNDSEVKPVAQTTEPLEALLHLCSLDRGKPWVAVMTDLQRHFDDAKVIRAARELAEQGHRYGMMLCLVGTVIKLPDELQRLAYPFPVPLPDSESFEKMIRRVYRDAAKDHGNIEQNLTRDSLDHMTQALVGLTEQEAERIIKHNILEDGRLDASDIQRILTEKRASLSMHGQLEVLPVSDNLDSLGGQGKLKKWLRMRGESMNARGKAFGIEPPRGVLLLGVPGCGKSYSARLVAGEWKRPFVSLDVGALYNRFIGNTEANLREALRQADSMAPCVLWIDEIEKAFANDSGSGDGDGGVSQRLFGTLLTWMNDRKSDVFIIATANEVYRLPPELLRKGRFDEIFFVDLPDADVRKQIFAIHLTKRQRDPAKFDLDRIAEKSDGFSGAEIEQIVIDALHIAFEQNRELSTIHLVTAIESTRPLSVVMAERIQAMRQWAAERCTMAD